MLVVEIKLTIKPCPRPRVKGRGVYFPKSYKEFLKKFDDRLLEVKARISEHMELPLRGPLSVWAFCWGKYRCDTDNVGKTILDGLVRNGIIKDDSCNEVCFFGIGVYRSWYEMCRLIISNEDFTDLSGAQGIFQGYELFVGVQ